MKKTENLQLQLWEGTDYPNIMIPNNNMLVLDSTFGDLKVGFDTVEDELTEVQTMTSGLSNRITENAQAIESLDDFDTKIKNEFYKISGKEIKRVKVVECDFKATITEQYRRMAIESKVTNNEFAITTTKAVGFQNIFLRGSVNLNNLFGSLALDESKLVLLSCVVYERESDKSGHVPLTVDRYDKNTGNLILAGNEVQFSTLTIDSTGVVTGYVEPESFYNADYRAIFILASI